VEAIKTSARGGGGPVRLLIFLVFAFFLDHGLHSHAGLTPMSKDPADLEMDMFFSLPRVPRDMDPLQWWKDNKTIFPIMAKVARKYLAPPPSSVDSERLFSTAGDIISDCRNRLPPEKAEQLIFLKINMKLLNFCYD